jgi:hypothetical protein
LKIPWYPLLRSLSHMALQANLLHIESLRNVGLAIYLYNLDCACLLTQQATNALNWHIIYTIVHGSPFVLQAKLGPQIGTATC